MLWLPRSVTRRDFFLVSVGAFSAFSLVLLSGFNADFRTRFSPTPLRYSDDAGYYPDWAEEGSIPINTLDGARLSSNSSGSLPKTKIINHAPGWTMFENLYMSNGTIFIVTAADEESEEGEYRGMAKDGWLNGYPLRRMMTSTGLFGYATEENILAREPTDKEMTFISREEATRQWGDRVWEIEGNTWLYNDPNQFLNHFYHSVAESFFGFWAFYAGTLDPAITPRGETTTPPPDRAMFIRCGPEDIRDTSHFNTLYLKAAFPSMSLETSAEWADRVFMTRSGDKAWVFNRVVLADRSASFRGRICGTQNQRIAAEALRAVEDRTTRWWWEPVRRAVLRFAGVAEDVIDIGVTSVASFAHNLTSTETRREWPIVVTYINRQGGRRYLIESHHERLVEELTAMCNRRGWEFNNVKAQLLSQEEQLAMAAKTTVMVGVHGNGLSHLISMAPTKLSTVVEIFHPAGFMHDYEWTARALGHRHFSIWNDTVMEHPDLPIPDGGHPDFQSNFIPVHAPVISRVIEERLDAAMSLLNGLND